MADFSNTTNVPEIPPLANAARAIYLIHQLVHELDMGPLQRATLDENGIEIIERTFFIPDWLFDLLAEFDADGDPDIEAACEDEGSGCDDEAELGWTETQARSGCYQWESDPSEPSLGSTNSIDQRHWAAGRGDDREDEHDGREPDDEGADEGI